MAAKFGDELAVLTYIRYKRWPIIALGLLVVGIIVGAIFGGLLGSIEAGLAGLVLGAVLGAVMGKDKKMFPVTVRRWVKYGGSSPLPPKDFAARVNVRNFPMEGSPGVEDIRVEYFEGMTLRRMPNFPPGVWREENGRPVLEVLQVGRGDYLAITWENGVMIANDLPIYQTKIVNGQEVIPKFKVNAKGEFEKDELGGYIEDPNGSVMVTGFQRFSVFNTNKFKDLIGQISDIPTGLAARMNNDRIEFTRGWSVIASRYNIKGFWDKYSGMIMTIILVGGILIAAYWTNDTTQKANHESLEFQRQILTQISDQNVAVTRLNAQVVSALLKAGWNASAAFVYGPLVVNASTGQLIGNPTPQLSIPFIG